MNFPKTIFGMMAFLFFGNASQASDKLNACFLTINSSEEKSVFINHLSTGRNAGKFEFHELAPNDSKQPDWFKLTCQKNIRCDILVISGHFAGHFFGSSLLSLEIGELEKRSCNNDCRGLMSDPKEVFLLGCNTLAEKKEDTRTASEYLDTLLRDNLSMDQASRTVEQRYGSVGTSFNDGMERAFKNVPHVYGFHSIGPSGKNIEGMLKKYHKAIPDYHDHLVKVELKRALALMNDFTKWNQPNLKLASALRTTSFVQTSGVLIPCRGLNGLSTSDPNYEVLSNICKLRSDKLSPSEAVDHIKTLLERNNFSAYIPVIADYLSPDRDSAKKFEGFISDNPGIKKKVMELLESSKTGFGKIKVADFALKIGVLSKDEFGKVEKKAILSYLATPVSAGSRIAICGYNSKDKIVLERKDLSDNIFSDQNGLQALECLKLSDQDIVSDILRTAQGHKNQEMRKAAIWALKASTIKDDKVVGFLEDQMLNGKTNDEKVLSLVALSALGHGSSNMYAKLGQMLESSKTIRHLGADVPEYSLAITALSSIKLQNYDQLKDFYVKWKSLKRKVDRESKYFSGALINLSDEELAKFYNDKDIGDEEFRKEMRKNLYPTYLADNPVGTDKKMPLDVFAIYLKDIKSDDTIGFGHVGRVSLNSEQDEEKFIQIIKEAELSSSKTKEVLSLDSFPKDTEGTAIISYMVELYESDKNYYGNELANYIQKKSRLSSAEKEILKPLVRTENKRLKQRLEEKKVTSGNPYSLLIK